MQVRFVVEPSVLVDLASVGASTWYEIGSAVLDEDGISVRDRQGWPPTIS